MALEKRPREKKAEQKMANEKNRKHNNMKSNFSTTTNFFVRIFFYAYWI